MPFGSQGRLSYINGGLDTIPLTTLLALLHSLTPKDAFQIYQPIFLSLAHFRSLFLD